MKPSLFESVPSKSGASINANWYTHCRLYQVFDVASQRREKTGLRLMIAHDDNARHDRDLDNN
jgi:hypothetical protein